MIGTEAIRKGWRIRPHKVRIRAGRAAALPAGRERLARAGRRGHRPHLALRDAPVGVARRPAADAPRRRHRRRLVGHRLAVCLARAGLEVDLGCRTPSRPSCSRARARTSATCPASRCPSAIRVMRAAELELGGHDLVCLAVPARALPAVIAAHGERITAPRRRARALQGPRPAARHAAVGVRGRALQRARRRRARRPGARRRGARARRARWSSPRSTAASPASSPTRCAPPASTCSSRTDVTGVELAGAAKNAAALAAARRAPRRAQRRRRRRRQGLRRGRRARPRARRAARDVRRPGRHRRPRRHRPRRGSRNRRAGELLAAGRARGRRSAARSARPPRRSTRCRCWPARARRPASTRRRSTAWPRSSRAGSTPSTGRRPSPSRRAAQRSRPVRAA